LLAATEYNVEMIIKITKGRTVDFLTISRNDGSIATETFPKKGVTSHDAIHYFVETTLRLREGFWGTMARGNNPADIQAIAKNAGHASASRPRLPDAHIVQLLQAERLVECFEADAWGTSANAETFIEIATAACEASHVPLPLLTPDCVTSVRAQIAAFQAKWVAAPIGYVAEFNWEEK
jgi:hypothetical protein